MSIHFQDSNVLLTTVRPVTRSRRSERARKSSDSWDFAGLLAIEDEDEEQLPEGFEGLPSLSRKLPLDPSIFMQQLYGREFDPATGRVNHAAFLERTQEKTAELADSLAEALSDASIDGEAPLPLSVDDLGQVRADPSHPNAEQVTALFAKDGDLAQDYRAVAQAHHWAALTEIGTAYVNAWYGTDSFDQRETISARFHEVFSQLASTASAMTYQAGGLDSASVASALTAIERLSSNNG